MQFSVSLILSLLHLLDAASAGWREECNYGGNAQFNIISGKPCLSTLCPSSAGRQICTMLDLSYCLMNARGNLVATINGHFERSCKNCHLTGTNATVLTCSCQMFGKDAPWQDTEVELEDIVANQDGFLSCWDSEHKTCPGFHLT